jgi:hypothetical protein
MRLRALVALSLVLAMAAPAAAGTAILMGYSGYAYEFGGIGAGAPSDPGDVLVITAVADSYDELFGVSPLSQEVTIYIYDLVSSGGFDDNGTLRVAYTAGHIEVYEDGLLNHEWGTSPPNGDLVTFTDGQLLFEGDFTDFNLDLTSVGIGGYTGNIDGVGGTAANICDGDPNCAYTFGGAFGKPLSVQLPAGYDLQITGTLEVDAAVPNESASFSAVKSLYRN